MARRYEIAELLWLRESPLVAKPSGLPPIEEWMPQPDPTTQRKQQTPRDPNNPNETGTGRRPSFFEAKHISRGSNSGGNISLLSIIGVVISRTLCSALPKLRSLHLVLAAKALST
ncbi:hypothetical protein N7499_009366 [Penicillium canescens]|nr:hypothetical protein N7522_001735 [Penicillium canescens]KAJ6071352.1 hypothetical protein N7499_009366 [Penicillium canescens]KAJ6170031.1 hypothetical protein N7485_007377 [Penicillium canescens]